MEQNNYKSFGENILDILCPKTCPMCDKIISRHENICTTCHSKLVYIHEPKCKKCGKELRDETKEYCADCSVKKHYFKLNVAVFEYSDMEEVEIPVPDIKIQEAIANIYGVYMMRKRLNDQLKAQIKEICPILIRGSLKEGA